MRLRQCTRLRLFFSPFATVGLRFCYYYFFICFLLIDWNRYWTVTHEPVNLLSLFKCYNGNVCVLLVFLPTTTHSSPLLTLLRFLSRIFLFLLCLVPCLLCISLPLKPPFLCHSLLLSHSLQICFLSASGYSFSLDERGPYQSLLHCFGSEDMTGFPFLDSFTVRFPLLLSPSVFSFHTPFFVRVYSVFFSVISAVQLDCVWFPSGFPRVLSTSPLFSFPTLISLSQHTTT